MLNNPDSAGPPEEDQRMEEDALAHEQAAGTGGSPPPNQEELVAPQEDEHLDVVEEVAEAPAQLEGEVGELTDEAVVEETVAAHPYYSASGAPQEAALPEAEIEEPLAQPELEVEDASAQPEGGETGDRPPPNEEELVAPGEGDQLEVEVEEATPQPEAEIEEPLAQPELEVEDAPAEPKDGEIGDRPPPNEGAHAAPKEGDQLEVMSEVEEVPAQPEDEAEDTPALPDDGEGGDHPPQNDGAHAAPEEGDQLDVEDAAPQLKAGESVFQPPTVKVVPNFDEVGASLRVLAACQDRLRYLTDHKKLLAWDGQRYGDFPHLSEKMALDALDKVHLEFEKGRIHQTEDGQDVEKEDFLKYQGKLRTVGSIRKALTLSSLQPNIQAKANEFDASMFHINTLNGVLNLETLELMPHAPSQLVRKLAPVQWDPEAACPFWEDSIDKMTCGDEELAKYLQRHAGYCLSGSVSEEVMLILFGNGANGKSLYLATLLKIMGAGEYALTLGTRSLLSSNFQGIRCDLRQLEAIRLAIGNEVNRGSYLDEAVLKMITSGDQMSEKAMRENPVQFNPQAKLIMAVNHLPGFVGTDDGIRRRLQVVLFGHRFDQSMKRDEINVILDGERNGIFAWMVRGFQQWRAQGLNPPKAVRKVTENYIRENDLIGRYISERLDTADPNAKTAIHLVYEDYLAWAKDCGMKALGKIQLGDHLRSREFETGPGNPQRVWLGIALKRVA